MIRIMPASKYYIWCIAYATKQHVAHFVDNSCIKDSKMGYFLSFKNNAIIFSLTKKYLNIASSIFSLKIRYVVGGRLYVRQNIVTAEYKNSICWTAINTHSWEQERFVWRYKRTLAMRSRLLKAVLGVKEITISIGKETGPITSIFDFYSPEPMQQRRGEVTDYQLRLFRAVVYVSIVK